MVIFLFQHLRFHVFQKAYRFFDIRLSYSSSLNLFSNAWTACIMASLNRYSLNQISVWTVTEGNQHSPTGPSTQWREWGRLPHKWARGKDPRDTDLRWHFLSCYCTTLLSLCKTLAQQMNRKNSLRHWPQMTFLVLLLYYGTVFM